MARLAPRVDAPPTSDSFRIRRSDIVVLGGGPAGLVCAIRARLLGATVEIVSRRASELRFRPGEVLPPGAGDVLADLGVREEVESVALRHQGAWVYERGRWAFERHDDGAEGYLLGGGVLHAILTRRAAALGVVFTRGSAEHLDRADGAFRGLVLRGGRVVRGGFLVDATGASRWLARQLCVSAMEAREPFFTWLDPEPNDTPPRLALGGGSWLSATPLGEVGTRYYASFPRPGARAMCHVVHTSRARGEGFVSIGAAWASERLLEGDGLLDALDPPSLEGSWLMPASATAGPCLRRARRTRSAA